MKIISVSSSFFALLSLLLIFSSCQKGNNLNLALKDGSRLKLNYEETLATVLSSEVPGIDWLKTSDTNSTWIEEQIMDGLVAFDLNDPKLSLKPSLAESWSSSEGGRRWVFTLRKDVYWSDQVPFRAQHVFDAFERILDPRTGAIAVDNTFPIKNAQEFYQGKLKNFNQVGVKVLDDYRIEFELTQPMIFFPMILTHHTTFPVRKDLIQRYQERWTDPENLVTLGAYRLIHWHHDSLMVLERNENYWGEKAKIKNVLFYIVEKSATSLRMFDHKKIDFMRDLPTSEIPRLRLKPEFHYLPGLRLYYYGFKVQKKPFNDVRLRKAFAHAIDRNELVKVLGAGQRPLKSWIPEGLLAHNPHIGLEFNIEKAKHFLKEAGYSDPQKIPPLVLGFNSEEKHQRVAENIQAQIKKNLNVSLELKNEEWKSFLTGLRSDSYYSLFRLGWVADYADPHSFMAIMTSFSANNRTGWVNTAFDQAISQALSEGDVEKRIKIYNEAQRLLVEEDVPVIPLFTDINQVLVSQRILNFTINSLDTYHFKNWELKK